MVGGVEPPPVIGHLSGGEPIVKPTHKGRFFVFLKGGSAYGEYNLIKTVGKDRLI